MSTDNVRTRRSPAQVRTLALEAARDLFRAKGYEPTSMREIASDAGIAESALFRHFQTKEALFEAAVLTPFVEFIDNFMVRGSVSTSDTAVPPRLAYDYVSTIYDLCRDNRVLLATLATSQSEAPGASTTTHVNALATRVESFAQEAGVAVENIGASVRMTFALVLGMSLFDHELFSAEEQGSDDFTSDLKNDMTRFILLGAGYRPGETG